MVRIEERNGTEWVRIEMPLMELRKAYMQSWNKQYRNGMRAVCGDFDDFDTLDGPCAK